MDRIFEADHKRIIETIQDNGFNPSDFIIKNEGLNLLLEYPNTPFSFTVSRDPNSFHLYKFEYTKFNPNYSKTKNTHKPLVPIRDVLEYLKGFLKSNLLPYLYQRDAPDPWAEFTGHFSSDNTNEFDFTDSSQFSQQEQTLIETTLNLLLTKLNEVSAKVELTQQQLEHFTKGIPYLIEQSKKQSKPTWRFIFLGWIMDLLTSMFATDIKDVIVPLVKDAFNSLFGAIRTLMN